MSKLTFSEAELKRLSPSDLKTLETIKAKLKASNPNKDLLKGLKVVIDAGHGGKDSGAFNAVVKEKDLVLNQAKSLTSMLVSVGAEVFLTRGNDTFVELSQRAKFANTKNADLFISLHANRSQTRSDDSLGFESYVHDSLSKTGKTYKIGKAIHNAVHEKIKPFGIKDRGLKQANFAVLRETKMPAILLECGFLTSTKDTNAMTLDEFRTAYCTGILRGIKEALR
ncbi:N-acetylmuramoyl-L-alanine amidase family protein [Bacillus altitudinis]|uniref:N-acetylmuramoyl-L-alanine amidase family protein n=1 Tax=Bacillus altitudinis TaxID=293387 RepID=UPI003D1AC62D